MAVLLAHRWIGLDQSDQLIEGFRAAGIPAWLTTHRELKSSKKIRAVFDVLDEALSTLTQAA